jgi:putative tryptophan/tyrosine transport system substrate-binding protein
VNRRTTLALGGALALAALARAQTPPARIYRVGYLHPTDADDVAAVAFRRALAERGYVPGKNTTLEERYAANRIERLPALAADLVGKRVDVIVAVSPTAIRAARAATQTIPIVMAFSGDDPVKSGFVASLAHPGGNTTGLTTVALDIAPKWVELARELIPGVKTIAVLRSPRRPDHDAQIHAMEAAAQEAGVRLHVATVEGVEQYEEAFAGGVRAGSRAIVVLSGPEFTRNRVRLVELATQYRLPSVYQFAEFVVIGGLMSYGPDIAAMSSRAAVYVDQILRGARPGDLPVEQPRKLLLVINRKTANALGVNISPALLLQADQLVD